MDQSDARDLLRHVGRGHVARVNFVELFFDLVFVFALTEVSHFLLHDFSPGGVLQSALLLATVWWAWICTVWVTNWLDPSRHTVRLTLLVLMLAGLMLSTSLPAAFGDRGLVFAAAYVFIQVGRSLFVVWAMHRRDPVNYDTFVRLTAWMALSAVFWIAGGFASGEVRLVLWILGMSIELIAPAIGYWTPGLGASRAADWRIDGDHIAERCALFVIIALGETILTAGATFAGLDWGAGVVTAFTIIFLTTAAMWWSYFGSLAGSARRVIGTSSDPGRIARLGYTYLHLPIVAGIIAAAASFELLLTHPLWEPAEGPLILSLVGGSSLYLAGLSLFSRTTVGKFPPSHLAGIGALVVLGATCLLLSPSAIVTAAATASILILAAAWETISAPAREMWHAAD